MSQEIPRPVDWVTVFGLATFPCHIVWFIVSGWLSLSSDEYAGGLMIIVFGCAVFCTLRWWKQNS